MRYGILFGGGVVLYALMFLLWSGMLTYGFVGGFAPSIVSVGVLVVISLIAGLKLRAHTWRDVLPYSFSWAIAVALLDAVFVVPAAGWNMYADWSVWLGYAIVAVVPLFAPMIRAEKLRGF